MATLLMNKYTWLVETILRAGRITYEEISERWRDCDQNEDGGNLPLRTFHKWRLAAEDLFGLIIECDKHNGYQYYIENANELKRNDFRNWLLNSYSTINLLLQHKQLKNRILVDDIPFGRETLVCILNAMKKNQVLEITYQGYDKPKSYTFEVEPYCVKFFKQRWYLVGKSNDVMQ